MIDKRMGEMHKKMSGGQKKGAPVIGAAGGSKNPTGQKPHSTSGKKGK